MGTLSLIFGVIVIGFGLYWLYNSLIGLAVSVTTYENYISIIAIGVGIIIIAIGSALIRKFDKDRKKEKNS